jgi:hypothetical protein
MTGFTTPADMLPLPRIREELARFEAALRGSGSATGVLTRWIAERTGGADVRLTAHVRSTVPDALSPAMLERLEVGDAGNVAYRRVWLAYAGRVFSIAENWYVPDRLSPEMNERLATDAAPFGTVVEPLMPVRETLFSQCLWPSDEIGGEGSRRDGGELASTLVRLPPTVLRHAALVRARTGEPICEVSELYTRNIAGKGFVAYPCYW